MCAWTVTREGCRCKEELNDAINIPRVMWAQAMLLSCDVTKKQRQRQQKEGSRRTNVVLERLLLRAIHDRLKWWDTRDAAFASIIWHLEEKNASSWGQRVTGEDEKDCGKAGRVVDRRA